MSGWNRSQVIAARVASALAGTVLIAAALYALAGVLQASMLFTGERALRNVNFWGSIILVCLSTSFFLFAKAAQIHLGTVARKLAGFVSVTIAIWVLWVLVTHALAIDRCLDGGGSFNYAQGVCDVSANHPYLSLAVTHGFLLTLGGISCLAAAVLLRTASTAGRHAT